MCCRSFRKLILNLVCDNIRASSERTCFLCVHDCGKSFDVVSPTIPALISKECITVGMLPDIRRAKLNTDVGRQSDQCW